MIPTHNCARFLEQTLRAVLAQDPGPDAMQIEVVDDCSTADDPERVVKAVAGDRVTFFRQPTNVGHVRNFQTCLERSRGELVHLLHGDDAVTHGFYASLGDAFETAPEIGAAFCRFIVMNERGTWLTLGPLQRETPGILDHWLETIASGQCLQPPSIVVRREVYEHLGGFDDRIRTYAEDWEMWTRIAAHYPVWFEPQALALYRVRDASLTTSSVRTGQNMRDLQQVIDINRELLPALKADAISRVAALGNALAVVRRSHRMLRAGETETPLVQLREALRMSRHPRVLARSAVLLARWAVASARIAMRPEGEA